MSPRTRAFVLSFPLSVIAPATLAAAALPPNATPIIGAMRAELERSLEAFKDEPEPPHFLSYEITETRRVTVVSSFDALTRPRSQHASPSAKLSSQALSS